MADKRLNDDQIKLVRFVIVSIRRGEERILSRNGLVLVTENMTGEAFASWVVARHAGNVPPADGEYLRVYYEVVTRWSNLDLRFEEKQLAVLDAIRRSLCRAGNGENWEPENNDGGPGPGGAPEPTLEPKPVLQPMIVYQPEPVFEPQPEPESKLDPEPESEPEPDPEPESQQGNNPPAPSAEGVELLTLLTARDGEAAMRDLVADTGKKRHQLGPILKSLMDDGWVKRIGAGAKTRYRLVE